MSPEVKDNLLKCVTLEAVLIELRKAYKIEQTTLNPLAKRILINNLDSIVSYLNIQQRETEKAS